jgi:hypothetical protein
MRSALERLVESCHGDDDPNCAILDELAVHSAEVPQPGAVGAKPRRKAAGHATLAAAARPARAPGVADTHHDLMAWTRAVHGGPGRP